jgi:deferrochelatase/peroxidase EfeB
MPADEATGTGRLSRRTLLTGTTLAAAGVVSAALGGAGVAESATRKHHDFHGPHQAGVTTPAQERLVFASFDVVTDSPRELQRLLATWTAAAARLVKGEPVAPSQGYYAPPADTGEAQGLAAAGLTVTVGFGASLFDGRFGLARRRPAALQDLPAFPDDALDLTRSHGDLCIQACADDAQVAFHAVHNLARLGAGVVATRWLQTGFGRTSSTTSSQTTPRNLLGFKDGTNNLLANDTSKLDKFVWVGDETDQPWMTGGTYLVARRIRTHLEAWTSTPLSTQQEAIGRFKESGAPLSGTREHDKVDLAARGYRGAPVIPHGAHVRTAAAASNDGARILRRGYSFADGLDARTGELDAGLFFICFQKDPRAQFTKIQSNLALNDTLRTYLTHTSSAVFACPPGPAQGESWAKDLFASS